MPKKKNEITDTQRLDYYRVALRYKDGLIDTLCASGLVITGRKFPKPPSFEIPDEYK